MQKCLRNNCPNHCCSNKFIGLSSALNCKSDSDFVQIQLDNEEVKRISSAGYKALIEEKGSRHFLKLNSDFSCSAFENGLCTIYDVRPDVCKLYPYYFDPFCGLCIDKNCPGNFDLNNSQNELYDLLNRRINLFNNPQHFFFDGYDIDNKILSDSNYISKFFNNFIDKFAIRNAKLTLIPYFDGKTKQDGGISGVLLGDGFHFTCHTFCYKKTLFIDCFGLNQSEKELLDFILEYFNTPKFDLCNNNHNKKGCFGKHIVIENSIAIDYNSSIKLIDMIIKDIGMTPISDIQTNCRNQNVFDIIQPIAESHIAIHALPQKFVADIFSCKPFEENKFLSLFDFSENIYQIQRGVYFE